MPEKDVGRLIQLAKLSPSSFNMQNYRFVFVRDREGRAVVDPLA